MKMMYKIIFFIKETLHNLCHQITKKLNICVLRRVLNTDPFLKSRIKIGREKKTGSMYIFLRRVLNTDPFLKSWIKIGRKKKTGSMYISNITINVDICGDDYCEKSIWIRTVFLNKKIISGSWKICLQIRIRCVSVPDLEQIYHKSTNLKIVQ